MNKAAPIDVVIDLSHHNGVVDFVKLEASGIVGVIGKASQGLTHIDPLFAAHRDAAKAVGLLWGAYHFGVNADGAAQADHFLARTGTDPSTLLAHDFESNGDSDATMTLDQARAFLRRVNDRTGRWPGLYSGDLIRHALGDQKDAELARSWLWLAQYAPEAQTPANWPHWALWQYTSQGTAAGIVGKVDRNRFNGTLDGLKRFWGAATQG